MDVKTLCLGVLSMGERSGYEIKKTFEESFRHFFRASYGSIYPALADLERAGHVECEAIAQDRRPDKKVYGITPSGREALRAALVQQEPRHVVRSEFLVLMYFAHLLPPARLAEVVDEMAAQFERLLHADLEVYERVEETLTPGQRFALGYGRTVLTAALDYLQRRRVEFVEESAALDEARCVRADTGLVAAGD